MNKCILIGRVGQDPEIVEGTNTPLTKFSIATSFKDDTEWHNVLSWGKLADVCGKYLTKGKQVCIEGRVHYNKWEAEDGTKRSRTEIVAERMEMLGSKDDGEAKEEDI